MRKTGCLFVLAMLCLNALFAQTKEVTGKVTDAKDGSPLLGVTVTSKNDNASGVTDADGTFRLKISSKTKSLSFSSVGYISTEAKIVNGNVMVALSLGVDQLTEVIVTGFGSKIKRDVTGSIAKVGSKELNNTPSANFESALQGRAAGVSVTQQNGKLGQGISLRIRGSASVTAGNEPLYVIDGIPLQNADLSSNGATTNSLTDINTNDIESIEILKDASAAAIYGSRASNGVVLITTKKGKVGKSKIEFGYFTGNQKPTGKREFMNAQEYVEYERLAAAAAFRLDPSFDYVAFNERRLNRYSAANDDYKTFKVNTDWQEKAFQHAPISQYDINFSGGSDKTTFYMGGQYLDQTGIVVANSLKRYSARLNLEHKVRDWLSLGMNMSFARTSPSASRRWCSVRCSGRTARIRRSFRPTNAASRLSRMRA